MQEKIARESSIEANPLKYMIFVRLSLSFSYTLPMLNPQQQIAVDTID